jgi:hypothetical protein
MFINRPGTYDKFLTTILTYADDLTPDLHQTCSSYNDYGLKNWMVAIKSEDRNEFIKRKLEIMPHPTTTQFIDALLIMHERKTSNQKVLVDNHGTDSDNRIFDQSIVKFNPSKIEERKLKSFRIISSPICIAESSGF